MDNGFIDKDILTLGLIAAGGYLVWKLSKGVGTIGDSAGGLASNLSSNTGKVLDSTSTLAGQTLSDIGTVEHNVIGGTLANITGTLADITKATREGWQGIISGTSGKSPLVKTEKILPAKPVVVASSVVNSKTNTVVSKPASTVLPIAAQPKTDFLKSLTVGYGLTKNYSQSPFISAVKIK